MDESIVLARNIVKCRYEDIPQEAVVAAKKEILDTLGTILAGSRSRGSEPLVKLVSSWGGNKQSTILGYGIAVPCHDAAFANGYMGHALDYDDLHGRASLHAGISVIPAALAVAEKRGEVSGKELIAAVVLGVDLNCRMGIASNPGVGGSSGVGWIYTSVYGYFGAAAAAGRILHLGEDEMVNALGIAYAQAAGNLQCVWDGALTKRLQTGFAAKGGVLAALLAQQGLTGARHSLEGTWGLYTVYLRGDCNLDVLTNELGKRFEIVDLSFKPYPCCGELHASIDGVLAIVREHDIKPDDVEEIIVSVGEKEFYNHCQPLDLKRMPPSDVDSQFSIPYAVAVAAVRRAVKILDFTSEAIQDRAVLEMAQRVTSRIEPRFTGRGMNPAEVTIKVKGQTQGYSKHVESPLGNPSNPMSDEDFAAKFRDCAAYSVKHLSRDRIEGVIEMLHRLEEVDDVRDVVARIS